MKYVFDEKKLSTIDFYINELTKDVVVMDNEYYFNGGCLNGVLYDVDDGFVCDLLMEIEKAVK